MAFDLTPDACIYCGVREDLTHEHLPPANLFPTPRPWDLITVPACGSCNGGFSREDEYFRVAILGPAALRSPVARALWQSVERGLRRSVERDAPFAKEFLESRRELDVRDGNGRIIGTTAARRIDPIRIERTVERIVRGLLWVEYRCRPSEDSQFVVMMGPRPGGDPTEEPAYIANQVLPESALLRSVGGGIFEYRHHIVGMEPTRSNWFLRFYGFMTFWISVCPPMNLPEPEG